MTTIFSETLTRLRLEAGFPTAYRFFHDNSGARMMGISYNKYLQMEGGEILPQLKQVRAFISGLRLVRSGGPAKELVTAWLKTIAGDELYEELLKPLISDTPPVLALSSEQKALKEALTDRKFHMTPEHLDVMTASQESYVCYQFLSSDSGVWTAEKLAESAGISKHAADAMIKSYLKVKLLRRAGKGFKCPLVGAQMELPHRTSVPELYERLMKRHDEFVASGQPVWFRRAILRADENSLREFFQMMSVNLSSVSAYSVREKTTKSAIFALEAKAVKLRDF